MGVGQKSKPSQKFHSIVYHGKFLVCFYFYLNNRRCFLLSITLGCFFQLEIRRHWNQGFFLQMNVHTPFSIYFLKFEKVTKLISSNIFQIRISACLCVWGVGDVLYFEKLNNEVWVFWDKGQCTVFCSFVWFERILLYIIHVYSGFEHKFTTIYVRKSPHTSFY